MDTNSDLQPQAKVFLAHLEGLPDAAWEEIVAHSRVGGATGLLTWLKGTWIALSTPFRPALREHAAGLVYSPTAQAELERLFERRPLPTHLRSRAQLMAHLGLQAVCSRDRLSAAAFAGVYLPFNRYIPAESLPGGTRLEVPTRVGA
jgi:hypothetical protein